MVGPFCSSAALPALFLALLTFALPILLHVFSRSHSSARAAKALEHDGQEREGRSYDDGGQHVRHAKLRIPNKIHAYAEDEDAAHKRQAGKREVGHEGTDEQRP